MAQQIADRRDIDFVLHEQLNVDQFSQSERYAEFNKKNSGSDRFGSPQPGGQGNSSHP